jgi:LysM repeat protein
MSQLTDKYGEAYGLANSLGANDLNAQEENGHLTIRGTLPSKYAVNQVWDKVKEIDPGLSSGDLTLDLNAARTDIFAEYEVQSGDSLSKIAKNLTDGALTYQQIFEANRDQLDDPDSISAGQKLVIPNF